MTRAALTALAALSLLLAACGGTRDGEHLQARPASQVATTSTASPAQTPEATAAATARKATKHRRTPRRSTPVYVACDSNIEVKASTTTCAFAQNAFYEYWYSWNFNEMSSFAAYSAAAGEWFDLSCDGESRIVCRAHDGSVVRFPMSAVLAYDEDAANRYAAKATVSAIPDEAFGGQVAEPEYDDSGEEPHQDTPSYDRDCADFAETDFPTPPGDPDGLDADGDGIACDS